MTDGVDVVQAVGDISVAITPLVLLLVVEDNPTPAMIVLAALGGAIAMVVWQYNRATAQERCSE